MVVFSVLASSSGKLKNTGNFFTIQNYNKISGMISVFSTFRYHLDAVCVDRVPESRCHEIIESKGRGRCEKPNMQRKCPFTCGLCGPSSNNHYFDI